MWGSACSQSLDFYIELFIVIIFIVVLFVFVMISEALIVMEILLKLFFILLHKILPWRLFNSFSSLLFIIFVNISFSTIFLFLDLWLLNYFLLGNLRTMVIAQSWIFFNIIFTILVSFNKKRSIPNLCIDFNHFILVLSCFLLLRFLEKFNPIQHFLP